MPKKTKTPKKSQPAVTPAVAPAPAPVVARTATESEKIWDEIKLRPINMFALPNQTVVDHCTPHPLIDPTKLYLTVRSTATLPSLETAIGSGFAVELADKFVIVSRVQAPIAPKKH